MTNMEWYVTNGSKLITRHQHRFTWKSYIYGICCVPFCFLEKPLNCQKYFFQILSQTKTLRLWISKIRIWIWSQEPTLSVYFMDSLSVFGFAQKKRKIRSWIRKSGFGFSQKTHPTCQISCYWRGNWNIKLLPNFKAWWSCLVGNLIQPIRSTTPNLGKDTSSVWNFCARFSDVIWRGNQW